MFLLPACQKPVYENTHLATGFLLSDAPFSLKAYIHHCNKTVWPLFSHLGSAVRQGTNQHQKAFGKKSKDMFQVIISIRWITYREKHLKIFYRCNFFVFLLIVFVWRILSTTVKRSNSDSWMPCTALLKSQEKLWQQPLTFPVLKLPATSEVRREPKDFNLYSWVINHSFT